MKIKKSTKALAAAASLAMLSTVGLSACGGSDSGETDSNGKPVVVADVQSPAKFNILGYPVILEDSIPKDNIVFGDLFEGYKFNFAMAPTVESDKSVAFRSGSTVYRVMALADGKPADKKALCLFTRAAS